MTLINAPVPGRYEVLTGKAKRVMARFDRMNLILPIALLFILVYGSGSLNTAGKSGAVFQAQEVGIPWRVFGNFYIVCGFLLLATMVMQRGNLRSVYRMLLGSVPAYIYVFFALLYSIKVEQFQPFGHAAFEVIMITWALEYESKRNGKLIARANHE